MSTPTLEAPALPRSAAAADPPFRLVSFPSILETNPYQRLLYERLADHGLVADGAGEFRVRWLLARRRSVDLLHFHWPQGYWRPRPGLSGPLVDWGYLGLFAWRLWAARALGYRIAWTIHQVYPHDRRPCLVDRLGGRLLARAASALVAHDRATAEQARAVLGRVARRVAVVPHGSYEGVYVYSKSREEARRALGLPAGAVVFLHLGDLRGYKDLGRLLAAFDRADLADAALVIAGTPEDEELAARLEAAAARDRRIVLRLGFVPEDDVAELYAAADVAVVARSDGGTSGSLILGLSMATPVVAADRPAYRELVGPERAGWLFEPERTDSLRDALERAARATSADRRSKRQEARRRAASLDWQEIGKTTAELFRAAFGRRAA